jgi:ribonuclease HI
MNLGHATRTQAELWTVRQGLTSAWNMGYKQIILEIDSLMVIKMIATNMYAIDIYSCFLLQSFADVRLAGNFAPHIP